MLLQHESVLPLALRLSFLRGREWLLLGASPSLPREARGSQVAGRRNKCKGEIISVDQDRFKQLLTAAVLVQTYFSECYFERGSTVAEMLKGLSLSFQGLRGLCKLLLHK